MSQLEPMMAEENKNASSYDGRDGDSRTVFVWGKTILVNLEGEIQKKYSVPNFMSGNNQHCPSTHGTAHPLCKGGGEQGGFTMALPKNGTASCLSPPLPLHVRE